MRQELRDFPHGRYLNPRTYGLYIQKTDWPLRTKDRLASTYKGQIGLYVRKDRLTLRKGPGAVTYLLQRAGVALTCALDRDERQAGEGRGRATGGRT